MASSSLANSFTHMMANGSVTQLPENSNLLSIEEIEERIQQLLMENADLRNTLQQNNTYMRQLSMTLVEWQDEVVHVQTEYKEKFEKAKKLVARLKQENSELKQQLQPYGSRVSAPSLIPTTTAQFGTESTSPTSIDSYVVISTETAPPPMTQPDPDEAYLPSYDSLFQHESKIEAADPLVVQLQREADTLRSQLTVEMESNKNKQTLLNETQSQLDQLMSDFQDMCSKWDEKKQVQGVPVDKSRLEMLQVSNMALSKRLEEFEEQIGTLTARLAKAEELALTKQKQNTELLRNIQQLESELDTLPILKTQVELYQTDFDAERAARQQLAGEKDELAQQVRLLKRQLESSTQRLSSPGTASAGTAGAAAAPTATAASTANFASASGRESFSHFECPKCSFAFSTNDSLNNHLDICLSRSMFP